MPSAPVSGMPILIDSFIRSWSYPLFHLLFRRDGKGPSNATTALPGVLVVPAAPASARAPRFGPVLIGIAPVEFEGSAIGSGSSTDSDKVSTALFDRIRRD